MRKGSQWITARCVGCVFIGMHSVGGSLHRTSGSDAQTTCIPSQCITASASQFLPGSLGLLNVLVLPKLHAILLFVLPLPLVHTLSHLTSTRPTHPELLWKLAIIEWTHPAHRLSSKFSQRFGPNRVNHGSELYRTCLAATYRQRRHH
jgi:hypothetical protein